MHDLPHISNNSSLCRHLRRKGTYSTSCSISTWTHHIPFILNVPSPLSLHNKRRVVWCLLVEYVNWPTLKIRSDIVNLTNFLQNFRYWRNMLNNKLNFHTKVNIVSWEPEGRYQYSKMFCWKLEGRYHCTIQSFPIDDGLWDGNLIWKSICACTTPRISSSWITGFCRFIVGAESRPKESSKPISALLGDSWVHCPWISRYTVRSSICEIANEEHRGQATRTVTVDCSSS